MFNHNLSRRQCLQSLLFGPKLLALRSLASGIPAWVLCNPEAFARNLSAEKAQKMTDSAVNAQFLILSASDSGEPINGNVPGMYMGQGFLHPTAPSMAETQFQLGAQAVTAAAVWSTLSSTTLQRTCFFHHATLHAAHGDLNDVHQLNHQVAGGEFMISAFAKLLAPSLGTIQQQPISLSASSSEVFKFNGVQQPVFSPLSLKNLLTTPAALAAYKNSQALRDADLDRLHALFKTNKTTAQSTLLDAWASSQSQARALPQTLLSQVSNLKDNSQFSQLTAAVLLCQMKLSPTVIVHLPFGGDNHVDTDPHDGPGQMPREAAQHASSVAAINAMRDAMTSAKLQDKITFTTLTTFGRSNVLNNMRGRSHNSQHSANVIIGSKIKPLVVGGAKLAGNNPVARAINSATGQIDDNGDIAMSATLPSFGKTLGQAIGLTPEQVDSTISGGKTVTAVVG